jgi:tRNA A37 methylthiotransferase MiaB
VGRRERVLCESPSRKSPTELLGRTETYRPVIVSAGPAAVVGDLLDVLIDRAGPGTLYGRPLVEASTRG